jgi:DNA-binding MarR family transcriptional regulator
VDKLVNAGVLRREEDPNDRRNIIISVTEEGQQFLKEIDDRLDDFIYEYFAECSDEELKIIDSAMRIVCSKLDS